MKENVKYLKSVGVPIAKVISCKITEDGLETVIEPILPMTIEKLENGRINIMKVLMSK